MLRLSKSEDRSSLARRTEQSSYFDRRSMRAAGLSTREAIRVSTDNPVYGLFSFG